MDPQFQMQGPFEVMRAQMEQFQATFQRTLEEMTRYQQNMMRLFEDMQRQLGAFWPQVQAPPWQAMIGGQPPERSASADTQTDAQTSPPTTAPREQASRARASQGPASRRRGQGR